MPSSPMPRASPRSLNASGQRSGVRAVGITLAPDSRITRVDYVGDEGGIVCHLAREGEDESGRLVVTSITHLDFDARAPLAREIAAYQKHRIKRLKRVHRVPPVGFG